MDENITSVEITRFLTKRGDPSPVQVQSRCSRWKLPSNSLLMILTLGGVVAGFAVGFGLQSTKMSRDGLMWLGLPGEIYMRMLKATILPLIISSVIAGTASLDPKSNGRVSGIALGYIIVTNIVGVVIGIILGLAIKPGTGQNVVADSSRPSTHNLQTQDIFADLIRNLFPDNLLAACFLQSQTKYTSTERITLVNSSDGGLLNDTVMVYKRSLGKTSGTNVLGLIICCAALGMAASKCKDIGQPFLLFFQSVSEVMITVLRWIVWYTPVGVASLIATSIARAEETETVFRSLGLFVLTVTVGVIIHQLTVIQLGYWLVMRRNPFKFLLGAFRAMITGFAPASSAIAIPEMMHCCEFRNGVDKRVSRFVVPIAATINRDGSCLFIAASLIYIAQIEGDLHAGKILMIGVLTTTGTLAIPGVPSASIVTLLILLDSLNIPVANIGLIMAVEWYMDRIRCASNVLSSIFCAVFTYRFSKRWLLTNEPEPELKIVPLAERNSNQESLNIV